MRHVSKPVNRTMNVSTVHKNNKQFFRFSFRLEQATITRETLQDKLEAAGKGALTAEERAEAAAFELSVEEDNVTNLEKELMKLREVQFRKKQVGLLFIFFVWYYISTISDFQMPKYLESDTDYLCWCAFNTRTHYMNERQPKVKNN